MDLISEGILTLGKVAEILRNYNPQTRLGNGPAGTIVKFLLDCDEIHFLAGMTINVTNFDPNLPVELETRPTLIRRISRLLEEKFMKEVKVEYY
ncbi:MAG: hypothetical protein FJY10_02380 [Bacteroidetes bacterium]|nr:hypothetical protein [Bacteroidota bacterium]